MVYALIIHSLGRNDKDATQPPTSVEIYMSYFYETNGEHCDILSHAISLCIARHHWQQARYSAGLSMLSGKKTGAPTVAAGDKR